MIAIAGAGIIIIVCQQFYKYYIKDNSFDDASFIELNTFNHYPYCSRTPHKQGIAHEFGKNLIRKDAYK
jgi:hypothetical protein